MLTYVAITFYKYHLEHVRSMSDSNSSIPTSELIYSYIHNRTGTIENEPSINLCT